jgi:hypothetical protein
MKRRFSLHSPKATCILLSFIIIHVAMQIAQAQIPHTLSYQGILADTAGIPKPDGAYNFTFRLYNVSSGGTAIWSETQLAAVKHGLFSTILGSVTAVPDSVKFDQQYWLGIQVASDPELLPRMRLSSVGSSINSVRADTAQNVPDNSITSGKIPAGQVVKSINNLHDNLTMQGANGASVTSNGDTITITASGGGGGGISSIQNSDNTLSITNPGGPTTTVNAQIPFSLNGNWTGEQGALQLIGDKPTMRFTGGSISGSQSWIMQVGSIGPGDMGIFRRTGPTLWNTMMLFGTNGNVGIGTATPNHKLAIAGGAPWTSGGWLGAMELDNTAALGWHANTSGNRFGIGQSTGGLYFFTTGSDPGTTGSPANYVMTLADNANVGIGVTNPSQGRLQVNGGGNTAMYAQTTAGYGVYGSSALGYGVGGNSTSSYGVTAYSENNDGLVAQTNHPDHAAISARNLTGTSYALLGASPYTIYATGSNFMNALTIGTDLAVLGTAYLANLSCSGNKNFVIDHPLDPANKTLTHSCIESNERLLMYSGTVVTDDNGNATVQLPSYFEALNINYRYQLTVVGREFAQARVENEISNNQFSIKTDKPQIKICWEVMGDRNDAYCKAHPFVVEQEKKPEERGKYLMPELFGQPKEMRIGYRPPPPARPNTDMPVLSPDQRGNKVQ